MPPRKTQGTKRKISPPKEDISSSDDEEHQTTHRKKKVKVTKKGGKSKKAPPVKKTQSTKSRRNRKSKPVADSSSSDDELTKTDEKTDDEYVNVSGESDDDDVDEKGNVKDLISDSDGVSIGECSCHPPESAFLKFESDSSDGENTLGGFLGALLGANRGPSKVDIIKKKIKESSMTDDMKEKLNKRLEKISYMEPKQEEWFDQILSIPFGKFSPQPIDITKDDVPKYFTELMDKLNKAVYGLDNVKEEIVNYVAQCLTSKNPMPRILALQGSAGTGKTAIVRNGIAKVLGTPMQTFSMGGIKDSSHFVGFDYTYQNSKYGAIAQALMDSKVMNPVIFLDELDKISDGYDGEEIKNLLIHMTDPIQNHDFHDKYFDGLSIDLSRVIFIGAINDIDRLNPILRDRLHVIKVANPSDKDKLMITNNFVIDELLKNITLTRNDFQITDGAMMNIIQNYSNKNSGIRSVKDCIMTILLKVNTLKLLGKETIKKIGLSFNHELKDDEKREKEKKEPSTSFTFPIVIDETNVDMFLKSHESVQEEKFLSYYM